MCRLPLFYVAKLGFVIWLQAPQTQGAQKLYRRHVLPLLKQHHATIDKYLEEGRRQLGEQLQSWGQPLTAVTTSGGAGSAVFTPSADGLAVRSHPLSNVTRSE